VLVKVDVKSPVNGEDYLESHGRTSSAGSFDRMSDSQQRLSQLSRDRCWKFVGYTPFIFIFAARRHAQCILCYGTMSVRQSFTFVYCVETAKHISNFFTFF